MGYPFSISETFQLRNTNATILESLDRVKRIQDICLAHNKTLLIYISMGFGNPYGDEWNVEIVQKWVAALVDLDIRIFQLSDTTPDTWLEKVSTAYENGCRRFDGTIRGVGGCPMAQNHLVGNMPSENLIAFAREKNLPIGLNLDYYFDAMKIAGTEVFV